MLYTPLTKCAMKICVEAHTGQLGKDGLPYMLHPFIVADHVEGELETCVALLHDVVEDTSVTLDDLKREGMPEEVIEAVALMTHKADIDYMDYIAMLKQNPLARTVKMQDLTHNMDLGRIDKPKANDFLRVKKYEAALKLLLED